jgi:patatin-like phospholipase/acyl hydrolase
MRSGCILALTGGGIMARFTTQVLSELQDQRTALLGASNPKAPIVEAFDLLAGTSAGALCVAGLIVGRSPAELCKLFDEHGEKIFPETDLFRKMRWFLTSKHDTGGLYDAVDEAMGGKNPRLGEITYNVAFPALDETNGQPIVFSSSDSAHEEVFLRDAVLASAAAPTYLPAHRIEVLGRRFVDGGLFANAPDLAALTLLRRLWPNLSIGDIHVLSIGTTNSTARSPYSSKQAGAKGLYAWATRPPARILKLAMKSQVDHAMALLPEIQLADFLRIDSLVDGAGGEALELDNASQAALQFLAKAGAQAVAALPADKRERLRMIVGRNRFVGT